jgi:hypothetical protein
MGDWTKVIGTYGRACRKIGGLTTPRDLAAERALLNLKFHVMFLTAIVEN